MQEITLNVAIREFHYRKEQPIFEEIQLEMEPATIIGLVAPNGTGKSTFINLLAGNLTSSGVNITYAGLNYQQHRVAMKRHIHKMLDPLDLLESLSGKTHLELYATVFGRTTEELQKVITLFQMEKYIHKKVEQYSLGMRQRLCFALAVFSNADILLLDEVMNGLDPTSVQFVTHLLEALRAQGKTIILASHLLENLERFAEKIYFLQNGRILQVECGQSSETLEWMQLTLQNRGEKQLNFLTPYIEPHEKNTDILQVNLTTVSQNQQLELIKEIIAHQEYFQKIQLGRKSLSLLYQELYG